MKKNNKNKMKIKRIVLIIIFVIIILFIKNIAYNIHQKMEQKQTRLLFDNEFIELIYNPIIEENIIYISEDDIKNIFDETIYYNVGDKELITTFNKHVALLHLDEKQMRINDSIVNIQGNLKEIDSKIYLPMNDLEIVYDIEINYSDSNNIIIINSITKEKKQVMAIKNTKLKLGKLFLSQTVEKVKIGDYLYIIEDCGRYKKVRSQTGNIGYIKESKISTEEIIRENMLEDKVAINILDEKGDISKKYEKSELKEYKYNVVLLDDLSLNKNNIIDSKINVDSDEYKNFINLASENDIGVIAILKNNITVSQNFSTYEQRNKIIVDIYNKLISSKYNGICIDFNKIDDINSFYRFLIEITPKFKESGLKVLVKNNDQIDKLKVEKIVDFVN